MKDEKTLRDELAMSMPFESIPTLNNMETVQKVSKQLGLEWSDDSVDQIRWSIEFQAAIRYMYADAMLKHR